MNKPGVILITTLLVVMIMSVISTQISKVFMVSLQREAYMDFSNLSYQVLISAESQAIKRLQQEMNLYGNKLRSQDPLLKNNIFYPIGSRTLEISVKDAGNCFNLNSLFIPKQGKYEINKPQQEWLERLLRLKLIDEINIQSFVDQLIDWVDKDNQPRNFGAEDYFYNGPASQIKQFTSKRLLTYLSEIKNLPILSQFNFHKFTEDICVLPYSNRQNLNINTLKAEDSMLLAAFFSENNLEFVSSQIINFPEEGYDDVRSFTEKFPDSIQYPQTVLSLNSRTFRLKSRITDENIFAELETLVILDVSNQSKILNRDFNL